MVSEKRRGCGIEKRAEGESKDLSGVLYAVFSSLGVFDRL